MAYVALYRAYRPQAFNEVSGQEHIVKTLKNAIIKNKVAHAYLFSGPRGTGKTTIAKIMAKAINCPNQKDGEPCNECAICKGITKGTISDVIEIDAASNNGVDEIREIRDKVKYLPAEGKYKVYIIDEVHMLSTGAFNALLKTLEEPPSHAVFILATTEAQKIPATILSRCQRFDFRAVSLKDIRERINYITSKENINITNEACDLIASSAEGGMRDALSLLDEAISFSNGEVTIDDVYQVSGAVNITNILELATAIYEKSPAKTLDALEKIVDIGKEIPKICIDLISFYRDILLYKNNPKADKSIYANKDFLALAKRLTNNRIYFYLNVLNEASNNMKFTSQKRTYLELALVKMSDYLEQTTIDFKEAIAKLEQEIASLKRNGLKEIAPPTMEAPISLIDVNKYHYITVKEIEMVLNNGNLANKKQLVAALKDVQSKIESRIMANMLNDAVVVAVSLDKAIITLPKASNCDYLMQPEHKKGLLNTLNSTNNIISDFYAIPQDIWTIILTDYKEKYKRGDKKPSLNPVNIGVRLYDEMSETSKDAMEELATDIFGDKVNFE